MPAQLALRGLMLDAARLVESPEYYRRFIKSKEEMKTVEQEKPVEDVKMILGFDEIINQYQKIIDLLDEDTMTKKKVTISDNLSNFCSQLEINEKNQQFIAEMRGKTISYLDKLLIYLNSLK